MNLRILANFLAVAEEQSITRAAERMYISQQSLSEQMARLESHYGIELFSRSRGMKLTYAGQCLAEKAAQILSLDKQLRTIYDDLRNDFRGELSLAMSATRARHHMPILLPKFKEKYPGVDFHLRSGSSAKMERLVLSGAADIRIGYESSTFIEINDIFLAQDRLCAVVTRRLLRKALGDKLDGMLPSLRGGVDIKLLAELPFLLVTIDNHIRRKADNLFYQLGIKPQVMLENDDIETVFLLAARSIGVSFYPETLIAARKDIFVPNGEDTVYVFPIEYPGCNLQLVASYHRERPPSRIALALIEMLRELLVDLKESLAATGVGESGAGEPL
ncbi:conserved hypothetical protein [uncultured delta proteobacterium]|uniref:HTH lysR-type domain-containing protein n=1 Tax=uncultured delta proteobacterium TaxID=34034 RepID=A0A212K9L7_9DELT|nr:conserved hypothetical protein [uncultured delta proteobacterium]